MNVMIVNGKRTCRRTWPEGCLLVCESRQLSYNMIDPKLKWRRSKL